MNNGSKKHFCASCNQETKQEIVFNEAVFEPSEVFFRNESGTEKKSLFFIKCSSWVIYKCLGCEKFNFHDQTLHVGGEKNPIGEFFYPKPQNRKMPNWIAELPIKYLDIFSEVYTAFNSNLFRLTLMGARLLIETFILEKIGDIGTFAQKVDELESNGFISKTQKTLLNTALDAGNAAAHRGYNPDIKTLQQIMDIVENFIHDEILQRHSLEIKLNTPQKQKNKKSGNNGS